MKANTILGILAGIVLVIIIIYSFSGGETPEQYIERIKKERDEKDRIMRTSKTSPFKENNIPFEGLKYFIPDPAYKISADFTPASNEVLMLPTSTGEEERYKKYGYAEFKLNGTLNRLLILELADNSENDGHLFIPFGDATSAEETYGAGRYLDIDHRTGETVVILDFNNAYNPYCAYSDKYSCPLPPRENLLTIPIKAGEKTYK